MSRPRAALSAPRHAGWRGEGRSRGRSCRFNPVTCSLIPDLLHCTLETQANHVCLHVCERPLSGCVCKIVICAVCLIHETCFVGACSCNTQILCKECCGQCLCYNNGKKINICLTWKVPLVLINPQTITTWLDPAPQLFSALMQRSAHCFHFTAHGLTAVVQPHLLVSVSSSHRPHLLHWGSSQRLTGDM